MTNDQIVLSVAEAAEVAGVSKASMYRWVKRGDVPVVKMGGRVLIPREKLMARLEGREFK